GEIVGLLGPNGAGKTTTLSILATLLAPDAGEVRLGGRRLRGASDQLRAIGYVPQAIALYRSLSAAQNLALFARLHGMSRREAREATRRALDDVGLAERYRDTVAVLSGGMQRRLNLACGMVHRPQLLLLDEPTVGVDPQSREQILGTISRAAANGAGVIYSTHYMEEVERICTRAYLIDRGRVVAAGSIAELIAMGGARPVMEINCRNAPATNCFAGLSGVAPLARAYTNGRLQVQIESVALVDTVLARARAAGAQVVEFSVHNPNLS